MTDLLTDIAGEADELTNPMHIVEPIWTLNAHRHPRLRKVWTVNLPSLLDQLAAAVVPGETYVEGEATRGAFASRPAARLDAVDRLLAIEAGAAMWCVRVAVTPRDNPAGNIRALVGAAPTTDSDTQRRLAADLHTWRIWAATVTGWEQPPHAPRAPCPLCDKPATLRIRLLKNTGCCMACGAVWDATNIGLLTQHITTYRAHAVAAATAARTQAVTQRLQRTLPAGHEPRPDLPYTDTPHG
jgi:hypothetical protein